MRSHILDALRQRYARETDPRTRARIEDEIRRIEMEDIEQEAWRRDAIDIAAQKITEQDQ